MALILAITYIAASRKAVALTGTARALRRFVRCGKLPIELVENIAHDDLLAEIVERVVEAPFADFQRLSRGPAVS
jgi:hypothetical protein